MVPEKKTAKIPLLKYFKVTFSAYDSNTIFNISDEYGILRNTASLN